MHERISRRSLLAFSVGLAVLLTAAALAGVQQAAGDSQAVFVEPAIGDVETIVEVSSKGWAANTPVEITVGFSPDRQAGYSGRFEFIGSVAESRSNEDGEWSIEVTLSDIDGLSLGEDPGFVFFKATSHLPVTRTYVTDFIMEVDGQRPSGTGEILAMISVAAGATRQEPVGWVGWRRSGLGEFRIWSGIVPFPYEANIRWLADGEWEIAVVPPNGFSVVEDGEIEIVEAKFCYYLDCVAPKKQLVTKKVQITNASVESVFFTVREDDEPMVFLPTIEAGTDGGGASNLLILWVLLGIGVLSVILTLSYRTWRRVSLRTKQ